MLDIAICDDDELQRQHISILVHEWQKQTSCDARVRVFSSADEVISAVDGGASFDVYILDIIMPDVDGIDLGGILRKSGQNGLIIYLTSSTDFAVDSYSVKAFNYLIKPVSKLKFYATLDEALKVVSDRQSQVIQVKTKDGIVHIPIDDIMYAELARRSVHYITGRNCFESTSIREPFADAVAPLLQDKRFVLVGASFAVNLSVIKSVDKSSALLTDGKRVSLPASACGALRSAWSEYWVGCQP